MIFDPSKFKAAPVKKLPVILLLDVSGSMSGDKIEKLYDATVEMVNSFVEQEIKEVIIDIAIITFGASVDLHTPYTPIKDLQKKGITRFNASGGTPLGTTLSMAKAMIEDKNTTPTGIRKPAFVLVSDGHPDSGWNTPFKEFVSSGRSAKCQRFAVPIGSDADRQMMEQFAGDPARVFFAENANDIADKFEKLSMSVSQHVRTESKKVVPTAGSKSFDKPKINTTDDDDDF